MKALTRPSLARSIRTTTTINLHCTINFTISVSTELVTQNNYKAKLVGLALTLCSLDVLAKNTIFGHFGDF